jgi:CYTH domain-containing protein
MGSGWVIIFVFFNQWVDEPIGHSSINQEAPVVYQTLKECSDNVMDAARNRIGFKGTKFGVEYFGEDEEGIVVTTLDQSSSNLILHHKFICMEIKGFE